MHDADHACSPHHYGLEVLGLSQRLSAGGVFYRCGLEDGGVCGGWWEATDGMEVIADRWGLDHVEDGMEKTWYVWVP